MLEIRFTSAHDAGPIKDQLDEALDAIGFTRQATAEAAWNESTGVASGTVAPASSVSSDAKAEDAPKKGRGRSSKADAAPPAAEPQQITVNPENRVDPAAAASAEAPAPAAPVEPAAPAEPAPPAKLTHDSVRGVLGAYNNKYGLEATREDGPKILGVVKVSDLADDQAALQKAVDAVSYALEENPYSRTVVGG